MYDPLRAKAKVAFYTVAAFLTGLGVASGMGWTDTSLAMPVIAEAPQVSPEAVAPARDLSEAFVNISEVVTPAVVRVEARRPLRAANSRIPEQFRRFFGPDIPEQEQEPGGSAWAGGSGFVVSADGYILTNNHVVEGADEVRIAFADRRVVPARVVGADPFTDVAVVKVDMDEPIPSLSFGNSDDVRPGEWILAIGNPGFSGGTGPLDFSVTAGIVSARGRGLRLIQRELQGEFGLDSELPGYAIEDFIQTDAVINPGNSGGPMVDIQGRVVGINSAIASTTGYYQGYGFAIPINLARRVMEDLIEYGHVQRPRLGVSIEDVDPEDAEVYGLPNVSGVLVQAVPQDGPAEGILRAEDVIVAIDGKPVTYVGQLQGEVAMRRPGDRVNVTIYRDGRRQDVTIRLAEAPLNDTAPARTAATEAAEERLGIFVSDLTPEMAEEWGYREASGAVITRVLTGSPADRRNLPRGWKIVEINDARIGSAADVREALSAVEAGSVVRFLTEFSDGTQRVVNVRMPGS
ncbi:MAG TPA: trypsin-like peptidase domain-containing protein [Longimicrobiales bacterium]|nr:trypsin-like peptidase domain-containing protein [Longimicrobiales bacterium]